MTTLTGPLLTALTLFALAASITPGPNNTMLLASGANFGLRRSVRHMMGVCVGFYVLVVCVGLGLGKLFSAYPALHEGLKIAGGAYMLYLAYRIATADGIGGGESSAKPQGFWQAAAFQWVNPKAWAMAVGAITTYVPPTHYVANVFVVAAVFAVVNLPCIFTWTAFGVALRRFLDRPRVLRAFNLAMAGLLVLSLYPLAAEWVGSPSM